jgi:mRNA interferase HicA
MEFAAALAATEGHICPVLRLQSGHKCPILVALNGTELLRQIKRYAKARGLRFELVERKGKGSHARLYVGDHFTTLKDRKKEIGPGLLRALLRQLEIDPDDL